MKVSIITVVYNAVLSIERTIQSVINQDYEEIEYIIIDGQSTDGTTDIIKTYENRIDYWISEPDNGIYDAMNKGIVAATGDIIAFINSGDTYEPSVIEDVARWFCNNPQNDIFCGEARYYRNGEIVYRNNPLSNNTDNLRYGNMIFCHQSIFARMRVFTNGGLFDTRYKICADYDWILRNYLEKTKIEYIKKYIALYDCTGVSSTYQIETVREMETIAKRHAKNSKEVLRKINHQSDINYINAYTEEMGYAENEKLKLRLEHFFLDKNNVFLFGAGALGNNIVTLLKKNGIAIRGIIDNDSQKYGANIEGIKIISLEEALTENPYIIVSSQYYEREICDQLIQAGMPNKCFTNSCFLGEMIKESIGEEYVYV